MTAMILSLVGRCRRTMTPAVCVRFPGFWQGQYAHPEGVCNCFHGGLAPVRVRTEAEERLRAQAVAAGTDDWRPAVAVPTMAEWRAQELRRKEDLRLAA